MRREKSKINQKNKFLYKIFFLFFLQKFFSLVFVDFREMMRKMRKIVLCGFGDVASIGGRDDEFLILSHEYSSSFS